MPRRFVLVNAIALACAAVVRAFDAAYHALRALVSVPADSLIHYHWILTWWNRGDSMRGFTLTPSPYLIDLAIQLPIALLAPDFEAFSYVMALVFALLIFASLFAVVRTATAPLGGGALGAGNATAVAVSALATVAFYTHSPFWMVFHAFTYNHTFEVYSTLGLLALLHALFRPGAPRRRYAPVLYTLAVAACVTSSPFFIATYCVPTSFALAALLGTDHVSRRRLGWFFGLTVSGAVAGLVAIAVLSRYAWPVRGDVYLLTPAKSFKNLVRAIWILPGGLPYSISTWRVTLLGMIGAAASIALAIAARRTRRWGAPAVFLLAFFPASLASCVLLPLRRGAFMSEYELRYLQLPLLLTAAFYTAVAAYAIHAIWVRIARARRLPRAPRWLPWIAGLLGAGALALVATARGPMTMFDAASLTSPAIRCLADAERDGAVQDGLATPWLARYWNAARDSPAWRSPYAVVEVGAVTPPLLDSSLNNLLWFDDGYRGGRAKLNFIATFGVPGPILADWRRLFGAPDRTIACLTPLDVGGDGKSTFDLWIWDREEGQRRLADYVTHDNLRSPFAPVIGATSMAIDPTWGMVQEAGDGELVGGRRVWRRGVHREAESNGGIRTRPMFVPSGRYRVDVELSAVPHTGDPDPLVVQLRVVGGSAALVEKGFGAGQTHISMEFGVKNRGGPTSGDVLWIELYPRAAESLEVSGMTVTMLSQRRLDPFRIFR